MSRDPDDPRSASGNDAAPPERADRPDTRRRWRLALGRYAERNLGELARRDGHIDVALDYLYGREYERRGVERGKGVGSLDPTRMRAVTWLGRARELFPDSVFETLQTHALDRYGLTELLQDPEVLERLEPNRDLLRVLLGFHGRADPALKAKLREVADGIVREISERLRADVARAFAGRRHRFRRSNLASAATFDWRATVRENLKSYDPERQRIVAERLRFDSRERRRLPWRVILCVDQSGSMTDSIVHAAVMAAILAGLPGVRVNMVLFDTSVVDVSEQLTDPLETLLSVQLGGGTDIGGAVAYCEGFVEDPTRTVLAVISDFYEGASPRRLYAAVARLAEARVRLLGLPALDDRGVADYDPTVAGRLSELGMRVAAMTPDRFAEWLAEAMA